MRLLLLLSAFLTAMVGVGTPAIAAPRAACEMSAVASVRTERATPQVADFAARAPRLSDSAKPVRVLSSRIPARPVPLYAERLRV